MFLLLRWPIFNKTITPGNQTSQITPNICWNKKTWSIIKGHFEELSLKLLYNVSCTSLPDQSNFLRFTIASFNLMSTAKFFKSYYIEKLPLTATQGLSKNFSLKFLCDIISSLYCPTNPTLLVIQSSFLMRCLPLAAKLFKSCKKVLNACSMEVNLSLHQDMMNYIKILS